MRYPPPPLHRCLENFSYITLVIVMVVIFWHHHTIMRNRKEVHFKKTLTSFLHFYLFSFDSISDLRQREKCKICKSWGWEDLLPQYVSLFPPLQQNQTLTGSLFWRLWRFNDSFAALVSQEWAHAPALLTRGNQEGVSSQVKHHALPFHAVLASEFSHRTDVEK